MTYAGGGGGAAQHGTSATSYTAGLGGTGGGGNGANASCSVAANGSNASVNTGGGGGGGANTGSSTTAVGGNGGSGIVVLSYIYCTPLANGGTITSYTSGGLTYQVHTFNTSGSFQIHKTISIKLQDTLPMSDSTSQNSNYTRSTSTENLTEGPINIFDVSRINYSLNY